MALNKQKEGGIDWTDYTWNPIAGCRIRCDYCSLNRMLEYNENIFDPVFRQEYIDKDAPRLQRMPAAKIFIGSAGEMWGDWVPDEEIQAVLDVVEANPKHTFQFLTKNPKRYGHFTLPDNGWYGTTVDGRETTEVNIFDLTMYTYRITTTLFVSFEPLLKPVNPDLSNIDWIIIGANSNKWAARPSFEWSDYLMRLADEKQIPVWLKDNYRYRYKRKEFPHATEHRLQGGAAG